VGADKYVATFRAVYEAEDEVEAMLIADTIEQNGKRDLEEEEGDTLDVTQVMAFKDAKNITPQETLFALRKARNVLIRVRFKDCYLLAQELDKVIHYMSHNMEPNEAYAPPYDYGNFLEIAHGILKNGKDPMD
jgi:hypothetical protein